MVFLLMKRKPLCRKLSRELTMKLMQMETLSIKVLTEMLHYRQEWIGKIQELEQQRQGLDDGPVPEQARAALEELSALAGELVEVDKAIFRSLEARKLKYIRLLSDTAAGKGYSARQARARSSTILDITQE